MGAEERAIVVDLVHIETRPTQEQEHREEHGDAGGRTEASSASRTAALVAPSPPDPDYFVG